MTTEAEYTIDELARVAETTVRSVRVYHERGLLPSPDIRGRIGYYGSDHVQRLETIGRLLGRGMKLNGIRELLDAWDRGDGLADVLGVRDQAAANAQNPEPTTPAEPDPDLPDYVKQALAASNDPIEACRVVNPRCSDLATRLVDAGVPVETAFRMIEQIRLDCDRMADRYAPELFDRLAGQPFTRSSRTPKDRTKFETDLAIARLIATRAATELIDQSFAKHTEPTTERA
ncbi:MerR family transcriptional regulator [Nocardia panacis]|uniref:MerR family transcriptional regulator n=1 Tax=Nocardia panacis TaxID=2340916 RepID=A0A3A4KQ44_9NOCA|nr:MerR family transcriptional regulator [Nocardia panacis]RJO79823.1 MerR family transcriptional regulator [Nocardia panacis]